MLVRGWPDTLRARDIIVDPLSSLCVCMYHSQFLSMYLLYHSYIRSKRVWYGTIPVQESYTSPPTPRRSVLRDFQASLRTNRDCDSVYSTAVIRSHSGRKNVSGHHRFGTWTKCSILYIDLEGVNKSVDEDVDGNEFVMLDDFPSSRKRKALF